jgi:hypothetical protein
MPVFVIERNFAERIDDLGIDPEEIRAVNDDVGVRWLVSFLSADRKRTYCLYEAVSAEAIRDAARRAGIPADEVVEISEADVHAPLAGIPAAIAGGR